MWLFTKWCYMVLRSSLLYLPTRLDVTDLQGPPTVFRSALDDRELPQLANYLQRAVVRKVSTGRNWFVLRNKPCESHKWDRFRNHHYVVTHENRQVYQTVSTQVKSVAWSRAAPWCAVSARRGSDCHNIPWMEERSPKMHVNVFFLSLHCGFPFASFAFQRIEQPKSYVVMHIINIVMFIVIELPSYCLYFCTF